jgi:uncharacterized membrane protein
MQETQTEEPKTESPKSSGGGDLGLDPKISALLSYLLGIVGGVVFLAISKNPFVKFHATQSIVLFILFIVLVFIFRIPYVSFFWWLGWIIELVFLIFWIMAMVKAYNGERYKIPVVGQIAEKFIK